MAKKAPAKKVPAKKASPKKVPAKKASPKKVPAKKTSPKKVPAKKTSPKVAKKAISTRKGILDNSKNFSEKQKGTGDGGPKGE